MATPSLRNLAVCGPLLILIFSYPCSADEAVTFAKDGGWTLTAPFPAVVKTSFARIRARPETNSPEVGLLREGAVVTVTSCEPDCMAAHAWALLGSDGAVELNVLNSNTEDVDVPHAPNAESSWYGRVGKTGITIFKNPRLNGPIATRKRINREMAFLPDVELRKRGWLQRIEGGFVRARRVQRLTPSLFQGELRPRLPLAFVVRDVHALGMNKANELHRHDRIPVLEIDGASVVTNIGALPRRDVRIITFRSPPASIPVGARWVLVDLAQQTLTAYEGDIAVYATLISSGKDHKESQTHAGLYQIEHKIAFSDMHGEDDDPYDVDRVPYALYFNKNEALHGTYWHDRFGTRASHGCINLALADARWLFDWAPPRLPENWTTIDPRAAGLTSLWVLIKERATPTQVPRI
jgi:hypothetical protein